MTLTIEQAQAVHSAYVQREYHYRKAADAYMVKYQLGKITKEEWEAKRQEVKDMLPYPEEVDKAAALQMIIDETS